MEEENCSQCIVFEWNDTVQTIKLQKREKSKLTCHVTGATCSIIFILSENVNQMFSDHVRPGLSIQEKSLPLFISVTNTCLITFNSPKSFPVTFPEKAD
jgi:hypothetical protein